MSTLQTTILKHPDSASNNIQFDSSGRVGVGTSPAHAVHIAGATTPELIVEDTTNNVKAVVGADNTVGRIGTDTNHELTLRTNDIERVRVDTLGRVGIGTEDPQNTLHLFHPTTNVNLLVESGDANAYISFKDNATTSSSAVFIGAEGNDFKFHTNGLERARINSDGRLLVGTSSATDNTRLNQKLGIVSNSSSSGGIRLTQNPGTTASAAPIIDFRKTRGSTDGSHTKVANNDNLGYITFGGADGTDNESLAALITAEVDGTPDPDDMPGRLIFSTTADGASSPTERLRISSDGKLQQHMDGHTLVTSLWHGNVTDNTSSGTATFDAVFTFPDNNNYMTAEIFGFHPLYDGEQEYYRFVASHKTSSNLYRTNMLENLTSTGSIAQTNTSITFTGRRPRSNIGTAINSIIKIICRSQLAPTSVTISDS